LLKLTYGKNITDRLEFLAEQFDVFDVEVLEDK
jgi:hypothetical protein